MLNLKLRDEFLGLQMPGTAITLRSADNSGALQKTAQQILEITYPTADVRTALRQIGKERKGQPIVLMGDRGRGKSHIVAVLHHTVESPNVVEPWAQSWGNQLGEDALAKLQLERGFKPISEAVHNHEYPLLWDLLFDRHPDGQLFRGRFQQMNQPYPPRPLLEEMFQKQPTVLILDEFQKWFDGLHDEQGPSGIKRWTWASNFIQNLSEIAVDHPDKLILVISVLNSETEAFRQVHRNSPVVVDFRGPTAKQDRKNMVLHRLFANRTNIPEQDILSLTSGYADERFRLRFPQMTAAEKASKAAEVLRAWPFAPELLDLLEDHILMAEAAQEARDLIRILAEVFRARGENTAVITAADFFVDDDSCGVQSLLMSIATTGPQEKLREIAQANLDLVNASGENVPHARELISSLWMRSMAPGRDVGGTATELQLDITRDQPVDDNAFQAELVRLVENSKNIHGEQSAEKRLRFELRENPRSLVRATAKNDKVWQPSSGEVHPGQTHYPLKDIEHIQGTTRHLLVPEATQPVSRVIVLGPNWQSAPWSDVAEGDRPDKWDRPILLVIPAPLEHSAGKIAGLGEWLKQHVPKRRNTIRFLLAKQGANGLYEDGELRFMARCSYLTSQAWKNDAKYAGLKRDFDNPFRNDLKARFDRFAVLMRWDYQNPKDCAFEVERVEAQGSDIPQRVEQKLMSDLFEPTDFRQKVLTFAQKSRKVGDLLDDLAEPPSVPTEDAIVFLGATAIYEQILRFASTGKIVLNVNATWVERLSEHENDEDAYHHIRQKAFVTGQDMRNVTLSLPGVTGGGAVSGQGQQPQPQPTPPGGLFPGGQTPGQPGGTTVPVPPPGTPTPPLTVPGQVKTHQSDAPAIGINLQACFEQWGLDPATTVQQARIVLDGLTVAQIKSVLQKLPSSVKANLQITVQEDQP